MLSIKSIRTFIIRSIFIIVPFSFLFAQTDSIFYFPMDPGNLWQYKELDPYIVEIRTSKDTTFSNGHTYRIYTEDSYGYPDTSIEAFRRQIDNKVYRYYPAVSEEYLIYDFSKDVDDTIAIYPNPMGSAGDTSIVIVLDKGIRNIFGESRRYMTFYTRTTYGVLYWVNTITEGIGLTFYQCEPGYQLTLIGAVIDNIKYGNVTDVRQITSFTPNTPVLYQNYPNPFNPVTTIKYQLSTTSNVSLKVYDILGREIVMLVDGMKDAGSYTENFDGTKLSSGIYFTRIVITPLDSRTPIIKVKKMLLMK